MRQLSLAFDMNPIPAPGTTYLSTVIDRSDDRATLAVAMGVADYFRLSADDARRIVGAGRRR
ncbi:hypothetical protein GCM10023328_48100 [Modestobacter marinus]|uniref:Uncharacterized protein n=2 Tax=Modestobacter marinus TaxID=477641 RepID=A0ABQ2GAU1_9ACTN|nr:hypothetical protein GCM10011589_45280 [Modestobacter marinus]